MKRTRVTRILCIVCCIIFVAMTAVACSDSWKSEVDRNTAPSPSSSAEDNYAYAQVPGEEHLIYLQSTGAVHEIWHNSTYGGSDVSIIVPFAPAYGYGGTYVYFIPEENKLVNENDVEVPGILRNVGDRPGLNDDQSEQ